MALNTRMVQSNFQGLIKIGWLILVITMTKMCQASVTLTVDGGVSLVGEHCPGAIKLFCEAEDLTFLHWSYNGNTETIQIYFPDSSPSLQTDITSPAFLSVELISISPSSGVATFSSVLTADLSLLQIGNVMNISCGNPSSSAVQPVNISIEPLRAPTKPQTLSVSTIYLSGSLSLVEVMWKKLPDICPSYVSSLFYQVNFTGFNPVNVNHSSCTDAQYCTANFSNLPGIANEYDISLLALNHFGNSDLVVYPNTLYHNSHEYFVSKLSGNFTSDCEILGCCVSVVAPYDTCDVQFTKDPLYKNISSNFTVLFDKPFMIPELSPNTTYFFELSVQVNSSLVISDRLQVTTQKNRCIAQLTVVGIILGILMLLAILIFSGGILLVVYCCYCKRRRVTKHKRMTESIQFNHKGLEQEPQISVITQLWNKLTRSITNQTEQAQKDGAAKGERKLSVDRQKASASGVDKAHTNGKKDERKGKSNQVCNKNAANEQHSHAKGAAKGEKKPSVDRQKTSTSGVDKTNTNGKKEEKKGKSNQVCDNISANEQHSHAKGAAKGETEPAYTSGVDKPQTQKKDKIKRKSDKTSAQSANNGDLRSKVEGSEKTTKF